MSTDLTTRVRTHLIVPTFAVALALVLMTTPSLAADQTYRDRQDFEAALEGPPAVEDFDGFGNGATVTQLFGGLVTFDSPYPTVFWGAWGPGEFSGGGLIPEPRFRGRSLILNFPSPIFGVGANVFDDFDGSPYVNVITLTVTTGAGNTISISEDDPTTGDAGFLGATSADGISVAEFSINNSNGNLEIDLLAVSQDVPAGDEDGDGFTPPEDCDDLDASTFPGAPELCDGRDNDCDGVIPEDEVDSDNDGYRVCQSDCNDADPEINPSAAELPGNFVDENCNGDLGACDPCATWQNHGHYVRCVAHDAEELVDAGSITEEEGDRLVSDAARSDVGKKNYTPPECL